MLFRKKKKILTQEEFFKSTKVNVEKILPRIENIQFIKEHIEGNLVMENVVYLQINQELVVFFVEEREDKFYSLQKNDLVNFGFSIEDLLKKATTNLANLPNILSHNTNGLVRVSSDGVYESSLILLDVLLRQQYYNVPGQIVVALPTRDKFFVTGSEDFENLSQLRGLIKDIKNKGYSMISDKLFLLNDYNKFEIFEENYNNIYELLSQNEFTELIIKKLIERIKGVKIISKESLIIVTEYKDEKITYKYFKCYEEYLKHPTELDRILNSYVNVTYDAHIHKGAPLETSKIFPMIRNKDFLKTVSESEHDFEKIIFDHYNEELLVFYVEDRENSIYFVRQTDVLNLNYSIEYLKKKAIENLTADWDVTITGGEGLYEVASKGKYTASLILMNMWETENMQVMGDPVITIVHPGKIYVTGSKDQANLFKLYDYIRAVKGEVWQCLISDKLFIYRNKGFYILE